MTILIFILVLVVLILVHEFGHFVVAKMSGMRVDEFGIGYPPKIYGKKYGETEYTINWLPFGGFVRIHGEDEGSDSESEQSVAKDPRAFGARPRILQALTLLAGITMNLLFAYVLISITLVMGTPRALTSEEVLIAKDTTLVVANVLPESAAEQAGLKQGDVINQITIASSTFSSIDPKEFVSYVGSHTTDTDTPFSFSITREEKPLTIAVTPKAGLLPSDLSKKILGISVAPVGIVPVSFLEAPREGAILTWEVIKETGLGLIKFFGSIFTFSANLSQISGPVGIAGVVGNASSQGLAALMTITAIISINLALINFLPIPALDGGRLLFVIIEAITRRPIKPIVSRVVNTTGFMFLILLMLVITAHDIFKLVY
jgi:regulator of sigma E protease